MNSPVLGYGPQKTVQELVEEFTVGLMMLGISGDMVVKMSQENLLKVVNNIKDNSGHDSSDTKPGDSVKTFMPTGSITFQEF